MSAVFSQLVVFSLIFLLLASTVTVASAAKINTRLTLDPLPSTAYGGDTITFSGKLTTASGDSISGATIYIKDDDTLGFDDLIATTTTSSNGKYTVSAIVKDWDRWSQASEIYAVFEGSINYGESRSPTYDVYVVEEKPSQIKQAAPQTTTSSISQTRLILDHIKISSAYVDDTIRFTGQLTSNGNPVSGKTIYIKEDDPLRIDKTLVSGTTNSNGKFSMSWTIKKAELFEKDFDIYATFEGDKNYKKFRSANQIVSILKYITYISMNKVPSVVSVGDTITFKGKLQFEKGSPQGALVYIKDEDTGNPDDLLVTAYVESDGTFVANWIVRNTDFDRELEIYAVFEGTRLLYRTTTCDEGPTLDIGGLCRNTMKMYVNPAQITTSPVLGSDQYFDLYYALSFSKNPVIALVPSPDDYILTKRSVTPSQDGILMWKSKLAQKYGGNWNVDFFVVEPNAAFWNTKPDIVMNIVSYETEGSCGVDWVGLAKSSRIKPIQTFVCASTQTNPRTPSGIASTAAHEFIHAMGLGHAFNIDRDMMCSVENNRETCSTTSKSKTPSDFSVAAVVALYGNDGFRSPNTNIPFSGAKFTVDDYYKITGGGEFGTKTTSTRTTSTVNDQCQERQCVDGKFKTELDLEFQYEFTTFTKQIKSGQNVCFNADLLNPSIRGGKYLVENRIVKLIAERFDRFGNQAYYPLLLTGRTDGYGSTTICHQHTLSGGYDYLEYRYTAYFDGDETYAKSNSNILLLEITNTKAVTTSTPTIPEPIKPKVYPTTPSDDGVTYDIAHTKQLNQRAKFDRIQTKVTELRSIYEYENENPDGQQKLKTAISKLEKFESDLQNIKDLLLVADNFLYRGQWSKAAKIYDQTISDLNNLGYQQILGVESSVNEAMKAEGIQSAQRKLPDWIKNNVKWWSEGSITDREFTDGIQHLINEKVISISDKVKSRGSDNVVIPDWIKNNAKWWADGVIGDNEFLYGIEYLIEEGVIKVNLPDCPFGKEGICRI